MAVPPVWKSGGRKISRKMDAILRELSRRLIRETGRNLSGEDKYSVAECEARRSNS